MAVAVAVAVAVVALADRCFPPFVCALCCLPLSAVDPCWKVLVAESSLDSLRLFFPGRAPAAAEG